MATYDKRVVKVERHEFVVPTDEPWGACWAEVMKAIRAAHQEIWSLGLAPQGKDVSDDTIRLTGDEESVTVFYVLERDGDSVRLK